MHVTSLLSAEDAEALAITNVLLDDLKRSCLGGDLSTVRPILTLVASVSGIPVIHFALYGYYLMH